MSESLSGDSDGGAGPAEEVDGSFDGRQDAPSAADSEGGHGASQPDGAGSTPGSTPGSTSGSLPESLHTGERESQSAAPGGSRDGEYPQEPDGARP